MVSDSIGWDRQVDAQLVETVRLFRRRRKWRHILALTVGGVLLTSGSAFIAAHVTRHELASTPGFGVAGGLYVAGTLLFAWGAAAGFTARLAKWLPATVVLGLLAVLGLALAAMFSDSSDSVFSNGRGQAGVTSSPAAGNRAPARLGAHRVLAADLLTQAEIAQFLGPAPTDLHTPGAALLRTHSLAVWQAAAPINDLSPVRDATPPSAPRQPQRAGNSRYSDTLSLTVQRSPRRARTLREGQCPSNCQPLSNPDWGGYVRRMQVGSFNPVTRVRAGRGEWVVALQLRTGAGYDPTQQLAGMVAHVLDLLEAASRK